MGRVLSINSSDSSYITNSLSASEQKVFQVKALEQIEANDMLCMLENGNVLPHGGPFASTTLANNNTAGPVVQNAYNINGDYSSGSKFTVLSNGNLVSMRIMNGGLYKLTIWSPYGNTTPVVIEQTVGTHSDISQGCIVAFGDRFVVTCQNSTGNCWYTIFNNDGSIAVAEKTFTSGSTTLSMEGIGLSSNSFILYYTSSANYSFFRVFDGNGVQQGSEYTLYASTVSQIACDGPFSDGSFVFKLYTISSTTRLCKYDSSFTKVFDVQVADSTGPNLRIYSHDLVIELTSGNFVTVIGVNADSYARAIVVNKTSGAILYTYIATSFSGNKMGEVALNKKEGGFVFSVNISSNQRLIKLTDTATLISESPVLTLTQTGTAYPLKVIELPDLGFVVMGFATDNSSNHAISLKTIKYDYTAIGSQINASQYTSGWVASFRAVLNKTMLHIESVPGSANYQIANYYMYRSSLFGVALEEANAGNMFLSATAGVYYLTDRTRSVNISDSFDATANTVPGNKGRLAAGHALLSGITI
ncbi:MAG: hypothetical protein FIA89_09120 [Geobacter sp.]|nr:hypothetical protein [Geobacter sp.]